MKIHRTYFVLLGVLQLVIATGALAGGLTLITDPSGQITGLSVELNCTNPKDTFITKTPLLMENLIDSFLYTAARVILGLLFFFQAYDKVFRIKLSNVYLEISNSTYQKGIPEWFTRFSIFASSYLELIGGLLLAAGLFTLPMLFVFMVHMIILTVAFGYLKGVWDMKHVFPRLALIFLLLLLPQSWNRWALDTLLSL